MHFGSPSDPSQTAAAEAKPRYVYSILKPHGQSFRGQVRLLLSQSRSQAVVCVSTPRMYPRSRYLLSMYKYSNSESVKQRQLRKWITFLTSEDFFHLNYHTLPSVESFVPVLQ